MRAKKRLGQHFLHDPGVIRRLVETIRPQPSDTMVEIGGGPGALTAPLSEKLERLHVVEVDRELAAALPARVAHPERLVVHEADALDFDFGSLAAGPRSLRVVGNLPYNISTPLLFHLAGCHAHLRDLTLMLQREVVDRIVARPATKAYGRLSVMLQARFAAERLFTVPAGAFRPVPQVESAVVRLMPLGAAAPADRPDSRAPRKRFTTAGSVTFFPGAGAAPGRPARATSTASIATPSISSESCSKPAGSGSAASPGFFAVGGAPAQLMSNGPSALIEIMQPSLNVARWIRRDGV